MNRVFTVSVAAAALLASGCASLTPGERRAVEIGAAVVVAGAVAAHRADRGQAAVGVPGLPSVCADHPDACR